MKQSGGWLHDLIFQRFRPGSLYQRYFEALGQLMSELAARGNVLLVGRGGNRFLRDHPAAFHVRLVAPMEIRLRRVMEHGQGWIPMRAFSRGPSTSTCPRGRPSCTDAAGSDKD